MIPMIRVERTDQKVTVSIPTIVDGKSWSLVFNHNSSDEFTLCSIAEKARESISNIETKYFNEGYRTRNDELKSQRRKYRRNAQKRKAKGATK